VIALKIEVNSSINKIVDITPKNQSQTIDIKNTPTQEITISSAYTPQDIPLENRPEQSVEVKQNIIIEKVYEDAILYEGEYAVTPKVTEQSLPTKERLLMEDVTIKKIPFAAALNTSGGRTVTIG
jgi:hypothetical protein